MDMFSANQINFQEQEKMTLSLTFKEAMDGWNSTFVTGDPSHLSNIVTEDFICRPTHDNENLEQVLQWATNCTSVHEDYKVIHEDEHSLCGFHSVTSPDDPTKRRKTMYIYFFVMARWHYIIVKKSSQIRDYMRMNKKKNIIGMKRDL